MMVMGVDAEVSSPSDEPWSGSEVISYAATLFARLPDGRDGWLFYLNYDTTRGFLPGIPLPGVAYQWNRMPGWMLMIGFPTVSGRARVADGVELSLFWFPIDVGRVEATWRPAGDGTPYGLLAGVGADREQWLIADRVNRDDRFIIATRRVFAGTFWAPNPGTQLSLRGGWFPAQTIAVVEKWDDRSENQIKTEDGWYGALGFRIGY
jgi:hypothetical protein